MEIAVIGLGAACTALFFAALILLGRVRSLEDRIETKASDETVNRHRASYWKLDRKFDALLDHMGLEIEETEPQLAVKKKH